MRKEPVNPLAKELLELVAERNLSGHLYLMAILVITYEEKDEDKRTQEIINLIRAYETEEVILQKLEEKYSDIWGNL